MYSFLQFKFSELKNKVVLVENTASLWGKWKQTICQHLLSIYNHYLKIIFHIILGTTVRDFTQMNELCEKYGDKLVILAFPTNQFGHQENSSGQEIINALKYVRPGNGFQPKCIMFDKVSITSPNRLVPPIIRSYSIMAHSWPKSFW